MKRSVAAIAIACAACGGSKANLPTSIGVAASATATPLPPPSRPDPVPLGVGEHLLITAQERALGPFLARRGAALLAAYVGAGPDGSRLVAVPLSPSGEARSDAQVVTPVPPDATLFVVRPTGGERAGFAAAWASLTDRGEEVSIVGIGDDGRARAAATEIARTQDHVVWIDVIPTPKGGIVLWAEETRAGDANLVAAALDPQGALRGLPARIVRSVTAWGAVGTRDGAGLALVTASDRKATPRRADVAWMRLDGDAAARAPVPIARDAAIHGDVDVARLGDAYLLAWSDASQVDPQVVIAGVDDAGKVSPPKRALAPGVSGQLVGVAGGPRGAALAWEDPFARGHGAKRMYIARVDPGPSLDAARAVALDVQLRGTPEIVAAGDGFALVAPARTCARDVECGEPPVLPTFLRFDARLAIAQVEPLRLGSDRIDATTSWGLACDGPRCAALALTAESPPRVRVVDLEPRATAWRPPVPRPAPSEGAVVEEVSTVGAGALAGLAAARVGDGDLVAILSGADRPARGDRRGDDGGAALTLRTVDRRGVAHDAATITRRALPVGGVAIAAADRAEDGAALAWVAREGGDPQVHVARLDARGAKQREVALATAPGDASDVALAWAGDGWLVAWVDGRDGNGEVYAAKVDRELRRQGREQRITRAPGDASDVALVVRRGAAWVAWADPRESPAEGLSDVWVAPLRPTDATRAGPERRVLATAAHSRSPVLAAVADDTVALGWIEEAPLGADPSVAQSYGAMLAWLDRDGATVRGPQQLRLAGSGFPTAIALDVVDPAAPSGATLHAALARTSRQATDLDGVVIGPDGALRVWPLLGLEGPPSLDVTIALTGDALYFDDQAADGTDRRARRAHVIWRR